MWPDQTTVSARPDRLVQRVRRTLDTWGTNPQYHYFEYLESLSQIDAAWLDIGCGRQIIPDWMVWEAQRRAVLLKRFRCRIGIDLDLAYMRQNREVDFKMLAQIERLPFAGSGFDLVTANMVVEHLVDPLTALHEVWRVLRPGGMFVFHTPNFYYPTMLMGRMADVVLPQRLKNRMVGAIEGRSEKDVFSTRYRLNTRRRITRLAARAGFELIRLDAVASIPSSIRKAPLLGTIELVFMWMVQKFRMVGLRSNLVVALQRPADEQT